MYTAVGMYRFVSVHSLVRVLVVWVVLVIIRQLWWLVEVVVLLVTVRIQLAVAAPWDGEPGSIQGTGGVQARLTLTCTGEVETNNMLVKRHARGTGQEENMIQGASQNTILVAMATILA